MIRRLIFGVLLLLSALPALAVNPDEILGDPALEARARALSAQLRCMVCQNQSIDDSNADLARDLRVLVRQRLSGGETDDAIIRYIVSRYGEFVLLKPRLSVKTAALWTMPIILVCAGILAILVYSRRRRDRPAPTLLTPDEQQRLDRILGE